MRKTTLAAFGLSMLLTVSTVQAESHFTNEGSEVALIVNDAETIIAAYIKAVGGKSNVEKIKNSVMQMEADFQGTTIVIRGISDQENNRMLQETSVMGNVVQKTVLVDGKGMISAMGQDQELTEEMIGSLKAQTFVFPELHYEKLGYSLEVQGTEKIDEEDAHKLIITSSNGMKTVEYYSVNSGLKLKTSSDATGEVSYHDYSEVEGVMIPMKLVIKNPMLPVAMEAKIVSMKFNQTLSSDDFK